MSRADRLALSLLVEPGDPRLRDLLTAHDPGEVLDAVRARRSRPGLAVPTAWTDRGHELETMLESATARAKAHGLRWVCPDDRGWPEALDDLDHLEPLQRTAGRPLGLWVRGGGDLASLSESSVAVVGARDCTTYGAECATELAADVADAGFTVVSGAAYGIDGCAHRGAFSIGRPTVAVLACGADVDYPRAHTALLARIAEDGVVVSEQAPGEAPMKGRFLSRNRLIAALSLGTVVVEAARRSGSLNTLHWADQLGRVTMALPGPVTSQQSGGAHAAVRGGQAVLVTGGQDVVEELSGLGAGSADETMLASTAFDRLPAPAQRTLDGLAWGAVRSVGEVATVVRLGARDVASALSLLERRGFVSRLDGGWTLTRRADVD